MYCHALSFVVDGRCYTCTPMAEQCRRASSGHGWGRRKRPAAAPETPEDTIARQVREIEDLTTRLAVYEAPLRIDCAGMYNMDKSEDKLALADAMWSGNIISSMQGLREANPGLVAVLAALSQRA